MTPRCVYCLPTGELRAQQVLLRGRDFYLCAPRGQLVEGYLVIAPYRCIGSLAMLPREHFSELKRLKRIVSEFYANAYGVRDATFYEQARASGRAFFEPFPLHAHLCSLPLSLDLHARLAERYEWKTMSGVDGLAGEAGPYVYVETNADARLYHAREERTRAELERMRLKPQIAAVLGTPERGHWRDYPGDRELAHLIDRFSVYRDGGSHERS